ncbi:MAG: 3-isopropylmalate dehydratase small subunit [Gammaproteobacteria bacterium]
MERFTCLRSVALPLAQANIDTDQILPARYLQKRRDENFGTYLFRDLRYRSDGTENAEFVLNEPVYRGARILIARENFGCGSSREHAVWALWDYGIRAVIAPSMGDIFMSNATRNGLLTIVLPVAQVDGMISAVLARPGLDVSIDLLAQSICVAQGVLTCFDIHPYRKQCLTSGLDELGYTLGLLERIREFERDYSSTDDSLMRKDA